MNVSNTKKKHVYEKINKTMECKSRTKRREKERRGGCVKEKEKKRKEKGKK